MSMLNPYLTPEGELPFAIAAPPVREGRMAPVTCAACGCRLVPHKGGFVHFGAGGVGRDARGCRVACVDVLHALN